MSKKRFLKVKLLLVMLCAFNFAHAQELKTITGTVKDDKGVPLAKATVKAAGSTKGVETGADGTFSINVPSTTDSLIISNTEFKEKIVNIANVKTVSVELERNITELTDVVVNVGYGTQRAKDVTGAITAVKGEAVKNLATQDVATLLQGRVAGVEVVAPSGQPGASSQITIRGVSSLNNANPLYVIDGVQQPNGNNINPADIESMSVLKDASAAAIYGASAAGGVIIITTKKGKGTKPTINFSSRYGVTTPKEVQMLDKADFVQYKKDIKDPNYSNPANQGMIDSFTAVDWNKELYQNGIDQNYTLSISGATPTMDYYLSGVYNDQKGVFLDNSSSMAGARINTNIKLSNSIKIGEQLNTWQRTTIPVKTPVVSTPFESQPVYTGPIYSSVPGTTWGIYPFGYHGGINAVSQIKTADFEFPSNNFDGQVYFEAKLPVRYLTFKATFGYTSQTYQNNLFQDQFNTNGSPIETSDGTIQNHLYRSIGSYTQTLNAYILSYDHMWGKHTVNLLAGYEQYANTVQNLSVNMQDVLGNTFAPILSSSTGLNGGPAVTGAYDAQGLIKSVFGRVNYDFNKHYYATVTVRRDANFTVFGADKQAGVFPAASAGWNINEERFFKKYRKTINQLKLRASYGELGNSSIPAYGFSSSYSQLPGQNFVPGAPAQVSYSQSAIANQDVHWESTHETNIGLDGQALNGKIYFNFDWYYKNTTDLLYNAPVSLSSGVPGSGSSGFIGGPVNSGTFTENIGTVRNTGLDIAVGYNGKAGQVNYSIGATGSFNTNKVLSINTADGLPDGDNNFAYGTSVWGGQTLTRTYPGNSFGEFWGLQTAGIYQANDPRLATAPTHNGFIPHAGDLAFIDRNHDGVIDAKDDTTIGNPYPKFTFGLNLTANWKQWDISILINGVLGSKLYNGITPYEYESLDGSNVTSKVFGASNFTHNGVANGVTKAPSVGNIDGFGNFTQDQYGNYTTPSDYFVESGNYVKLKNLQIGYTLSSKILNKVKIKSVRFYLMANNLLTITKYSGIDPELGSQYAILGLDKNGNVTGNADGSAVARGGSATTSRGIDGPSRYPSVKLYAAGLDVTF